MEELSAPKDGLQFGDCTGYLPTNLNEEQDLGKNDVSNGDERQIYRSEDNFSLHEGWDNKDATIVALSQSKEQDNKILSKSIVLENQHCSTPAAIDPPDSIHGCSLNIPDRNMPDFNMPDYNYNMPDFDMPDFNIPDYNYNMPQFDMPDYNMNFNIRKGSPSAIVPQSSSNIDDPTLCNTQSAFDYSTFVHIRDAIENDNASIHKPHLLPERLPNENSILIGPSVQSDGIDAHTEVCTKEDMLKEARVAIVSPNGDDTPSCGTLIRERLPDEDSTAPAHAGHGLTDKAHSPGPTDTNASSGLEDLSTSSSTSLAEANSNIRFTSSDRVEPLELTDRIKQSLENMCGRTIVWWPLKPRRQFCPRGFTRISWECVRKIALSNLYVIF